MIIKYHKNKVPEPCGGVILVGTQTITYCNKTDDPVCKTPPFLKVFLVFFSFKLICVNYRINYFSN